jgi:hypothetical protein
MVRFQSPMGLESLALLGRDFARRSTLIGGLILKNINVNVGMILTGSR